MDRRYITPNGKYKIEVHIGDDHVTITAENAYKGIKPVRKLIINSIEEAKYFFNLLNDKMPEILKDIENKYHVKQAETAK